jgi:hypothetical protein
MSWSSTPPHCSGFFTDEPFSHVWVRTSATRDLCTQCHAQRRMPRKGESFPSYRSARADWKRLGLVSEAVVFFGSGEAMELPAGLVLWRQGKEYRLTPPGQRPRSRQ